MFTGSFLAGCSLAGAASIASCLPRAGSFDTAGLAEASPAELQGLTPAEDSVASSSSPCPAGATDWVSSVESFSAVSTGAFSSSGCGTSSEAKAEGVKGRIGTTPSLTSPVPANVALAFCSLPANSSSRPSDSAVLAGSSGAFALSTTPTAGSGCESAPSSIAGSSSAGILGLFELNGTTRH